MSISKTKTYNIFNRKTDELLSAKVSGSDVQIVESALVQIGYDVVVKETASGGSTGAGSIAVNMDAKKYSIKDFMKQFQSKVKNLAAKPMYITVSEAFDIESVFSRLSSMEKSGSTNKTDGTTFGVEDDQGNLMKVTVRSDQAKEFEQEIATHLADIKTGVVGMPKPRGATEVSIAELLFKLKDRFDIIDVDFPKIPTDVVYNADKASPAGQVDPNLVADAGMGDEFGDMGDAGMDDTGMGDEFGEEGDDPNAPLDLTDYKQPDDEEGEVDIDLDNPEGMEGMDDESVEDFPPEAEDSEGSILNQVITMLKAQAEAETAKANAEAEKARADQARYASQASQQAVKDQEESLRYELEMEQQKKAEKESDKMADMAKYKLSKAMGMRESVVINELDLGSEPSAFIAKERQAVNQQFEILPTDDQETKLYKTKQRAEALRLLAARFRIAVNRERYAALMKQQGKGQQQQQNPNPNQQPQGQNQQQAQQQGQNQQQNPNPNPQRR